MQTVVEQLLQYPQVHLYLDQVQDALRAEQRKRRSFHKSLPAEKDAEFINGEVIERMSNNLEHNEACFLLSKLLDTHVRKQRLGRTGFEKLMISLTRNDYEPDICFWTTEKAAQFEPRQRLFPAPDFIVEVLSDSTEKRDRGVKFLDYAAHGVSEYWLVDAEKKVVEQYVLQQGFYELALKSGTGYVQSVVITDFRIPVEAIFNEEINLKTLQQLIGA
jgi:Uma2 family endonuclease